MGLFDLPFKYNNTMPPISAFMCCLSDEEILKHTTLGISHNGAVLDIDIINKEDILMIEKLEAYRAELEAKKAEALAKDITPIIDEKVADYRAKCEAEAATELNNYVAKLDSDINCIDSIIARELAAAANAEPIQED